MKKQQEEPVEVEEVAESGSKKEEEKQEEAPKKRGGRRVVATRTRKTSVKSVSTPRESCGWKSCSVEPSEESDIGGRMEAMVGRRRTLW